LASAALSGAETLDKYRRKDAIEKGHGLDDIKSRVDMRSMKGRGTRDSKTADASRYTHSEH
jgi:hypothetical protein